MTLVEPYAERARYADEMPRNPPRAMVLRLAAVATILVNLAPGPIARADDPVSDLEAVKKVILELESRRRAEADEELRVLREKLATVEARAQYMRRWTRTQFELDERGMISHPQAVPRYLERLQRHRETTLFHFLQFRDDSRGAVKNGRALNFFLQQCGAAAFEIVEYRRLGQDAREVAESDRIERELLMFSKLYVVDDQLLRHVRYLRGLVGAVGTGRLNQDQDVLDLDRVESLLRTDEFSPQLDRIRLWRDSAMTELRAGKPVSADTAARLIEAVKTLLVDLRVKKKERARRHAAFNDFRPYLDAERHMLSVSRGAARLIEAHQLDDMALERFKGENVEDLLAYMYRNNLRFDGADTNGENAYRMLFELLAKYYVDLRNMQQAAVEADRAVATLKGQEQDLLAVKLGNQLDNLQKFELTKDAIQLLRDAVNK